MGYDKIHFLASERHFADHLEPVYDQLPKDVRGVFSREGDPRPPRGELTVVAAWGDLDKTKGSPVVLFEHGVGQTYQGQKIRNFAGGRGRDHVVGFAVPNRMVYDINAEAYPGVPQEIVGLPRLWPWLTKKRGKFCNFMPADPVVAVSFHWDSFVCPETRTTWPYYRWALTPLAEKVRVLGHGHPRIYDDIQLAYQAMGVEPVREFSKVLDLADVYVCDNSSTLYEFAATGKPVVVLNQPSYRRDVEHGLRFWSHAGVGVNCDHPDALERCVKIALEDPLNIKSERERIVREVVPHGKDSMRRTVRFLLEIRSGELRPSKARTETAARNLLVDCSCGETMRRAVLEVHQRQRGCT